MARTKNLRHSKTPPKSRQQPPSPYLDPDEKPPFISSLEEARQHFWNARSPELPRLEEKIEGIREKRDKAGAELEELEAMFPFSELENSASEAGTDPARQGGPLPDNLAITGTYMGRHKRLREQFRQLDQEFKDTQARINALCYFGKIHGLTSSIEIHTPDCRSFTFNGKRYNLGVPHGKAIKLLIEKAAENHPNVPVQDILTKMGRSASKLRDSFRPKGLWNTLLVSKERGTRRLAAYPPNYGIPT
ncbi:hypothetical protein MYX75_02760 [Acidobacteria bacterium AH-259-A15]|nr:hypothetical protein [Acidobacteria bacterium AH-259-A15]